METYEAPTKQDIETYFRAQGHPDFDKWEMEQFVLPDKYERRYQYWQCIAEDIDLCDFDRWQHFENVIGVMIGYETFCTIMNALWEEDVEILELKSDSPTCW